MTFKDLKDLHSEMDFTIKPRRIIAICKCGPSSAPHRRVFEFSQLNDVTLGVIDNDLKSHEDRNVIA